MKIAVFGKRRQSPHDIEGIVSLLDQMSARGMFVAVEARLYEALAPERGDVAADDVFDCSSVDADMAFSIGGDGTFLRTARAIGNRGIPIMGFNTGTLGFLAEESLADAPQILDELACGEYTIEQRGVIEVSYEGQIPVHRRQRLFALNEVAVVRDDAASMVTVHAWLDGKTLASYRGDGLLVATPTGSTAYNLSVGGPIIEPTAPCRVLAPIAPHSLTIRPLVVADTRRIEVEVESRAPTFRLAVDGKGVSLPCGTHLTIGTASFTTRIVHRPGANFATTLRDKLLWGQ